MKISNVFNINASKKGGILVEFALGIPLLVTILYFSLDVPRYSRYKSQMKNAAYIAASMIQNVAQNRTTNKRIKKADCINIGNSWGMAVWGGGASNGYRWGNVGGYYPLGIATGMRMFYIKGTGLNKAKIIWANYFTTISLTNYGSYSSSGQAAGGPSLLYGKNLNTEYESTAIYKDLKINEGEIKLLLEIYIYINRSYQINSSTYSWGSSTATTIPPALLGFYLLRPKPSADNYSSTEKGMFNTVVIFAPRPGLFSEIPPS